MLLARHFKPPPKEQGSKQTTASDQAQTINIANGWRWRVCESKQAWEKWRKFRMEAPLEELAMINGLAWQYYTMGLTMLLSNHRHHHQPGQWRWWSICCCCWFLASWIVSNWWRKQQASSYECHPVGAQTMSDNFRAPSFIQEEVITRIKHSVTMDQWLFS